MSTRTLKVELLREGPWDHGRYLGVPNFSFDVPEIAEAVAYMSAANIADHPFFTYARSDSNALRLWAEQEMIVSSVFSQALAAWISNLDNCHVRAVVLPVLVGEHGVVEGSKSLGAHPVLAEQLCSSIGTRFERVHALPGTASFIEEMERCASNPMRGAGFLGIGNEFMLIPEYITVMECFEKALPLASFKEFLVANIEDDRRHHLLIEIAVRGLVSLGLDPIEFLEGARLGVDSRILYFDELKEFCLDRKRLSQALAR